MMDMNTRRAAFLNSAVDRILKIPGVKAGQHDISMASLSSDVIAKRTVTVAVYSDAGVGWTIRLKEAVEELKDNLEHNVPMEDRRKLDWFVLIPKAYAKEDNPLKVVGTVSYRYSDDGKGIIYTDLDL